MLATESDSHTHIFGSGLDVYPWWVTFDGNEQSGPHGEYFEAIDGWAITVTALDPDGDQVEDTVTKIITHDSLITAMSDIDKGLKGSTSSACDRECAAFLADPNDADFDSETADEVLQVAMYGKVIYG